MYPFGVFHKDHTLSEFNITKLIFVYNSMLFSRVNRWTIKCTPIMITEKGA